MSKYTGPKIRMSRKLGIALTLKASKYMDRKPYPPGQHGPDKRGSKMSDYKRQLLEKQRLRAQYNLHERQLRNYYLKAHKMKGNTGDLLIRLLETRLDAFVLRAGFARSIYAARQYVNHGHVLVNGKRVNISSYQLKPKDMVSIKEKSREVACFGQALKSANPPAYVSLAKQDFTAQLMYYPERPEIPTICEMNIVVEYYSR